MADFGSIPNLLQEAAAFQAEYATLLALKQNANTALDEDDAALRAIAQWGNWVDGNLVVLQSDLADRRVGAILRLGDATVHYVDAQPEGELAAPVGDYAFVSDGTIWAKTSGGSTSSGWTAIGGGSVSLGDLPTASARSVLGRAANSAGDRADIQGAGARTVLSEGDDSTLAFRSLSTILVGDPAGDIFLHFGCNTSSTLVALPINGDATASVNVNIGNANWLAPFDCTVVEVVVRCVGAVNYDSTVIATHIDGGAAVDSDTHELDAGAGDVTFTLGTDVDAGSRLAISFDATTNGDELVGYVRIRRR